jgi:hypothetical protein
MILESKQGPTSGAETRVFEDLSGTTKVVPLPFVLVSRLSPHPAYVTNVHL